MAVNPDNPQPSLELILYRLTELTRTVERGFERVDGRLDHFETRLGQLEQWRAVSEDRHVQEQQAQHDDPVSGPDWVKIVLALVALVGTALTIIAQRGGV